MLPQTKQTPHNIKYNQVVFLLKKFLKKLSRQSVAMKIFSRLFFVDVF